MGKKYFFSKDAKTDKFHKVSLMDISILLGNVWKGAKDPQIGFEDAEQTIQDLTNNMNHEIWLKLSDLESALWACNLLNESGKFWHPRDRSFDEFIKKLLKLRTFNKVYNTVELEKK